MDDITFAIDAVPASLQQKSNLKWTLNHFPCKCMFSSAEPKSVKLSSSCVVLVAHPLGCQ
jgi:hypothetical protein